MELKVELEVCAGFANRLRSLVSGICYAEELQKKLIVHWVPDIHCFIKLEDIVYLDSLPPFVKVLTSYSYKQHTMVYKQEDLESKPLLIKSYAHFYTKNQDIFNKHLRAIRFKRVPITDKSMIGIHIRRTDHTKCIEHSPTDFFIEKIKSYPNDTIFYLATDCNKTKELLKTMFGKQILIKDILLKRTSVNGMLGALDDFVNLSNCKEIIGTKYSSFSEMASLYGNI